MCKCMSLALVPVKVLSHGQMVWSLPMMDTLRRKHCLCLQCGAVDECEKAKLLYDMCKEHNMAMAITRCAEWRVKDV